VGIACLGLVPILGGPDAPLHWFMTAGISGLGVLLWVRHRLYQREQPLAALSVAEARRAGRYLFIITGISGVLAAGISALWLVGGGKPLAVSLVLPAVGLVWLLWLGVKVSRAADQSPAVAAEEAQLTRPSPSGWEARPSQAPGARSGPNRQVNA
jgi:hypothetical protein